MSHSQLIILTGSIAEKDRNLAAIAEFTGITPQIIEFTKNIEEFRSLLAGTADKKNIAAVNIKLIENICRGQKELAEISEIFYRSFKYIFFYNFGESSRTVSIITELSQGKLKSAIKTTDENVTFDIHGNFENICSNFSGIAVKSNSRKVNFYFEKNNSDVDIDNLISINSLPWFVRIRERECELFFYGCSEFTDINKKIERFRNIEDEFDGLIPPVMFIKYAFGDKCWHSPAANATIIIDDPILKKRYGYINFEQLLTEAEKYNFSVNIGFIPFNFKKNNREVIELFKDNNRYLSISVHGNDHTRGEFGTSDIQMLNWQVQQAEARMEKHKSENLIDYDKVMIFPQGIFSKESFYVLKNNNFLAAVNSGSRAVNIKEKFVISDFLTPAFLRYDSFPLFLRRYPGPISNFAFDLFFGKPLLIVEHHEIFRGGYENFNEFIDKINSLAQNISWSNLTDTLGSSYLEKLDDEGRSNIKIFSNKTIIKRKPSLSYRIEKNESNPSLISCIKVNSEKITDFHTDKSTISFHNV